MLRYFLKRLLWMIPIILAVAIVVFTLMTYCPGDPAEIILGSEATEEALEAKREELGLNDPYFVRLARFLSDTFIHFNLGTFLNIESAEEFMKTIDNEAIFWCKGYSCKWDA